MHLKYFTYLSLAGLLFFLLCNPLSLYFLSDDFDSMYAAQTGSGIIHSYRPGSDLLLHTDHLLYGYNASGYHVTNYLLHFLTTLLLFFTTQQLLLPFYNKTAIDKYAIAASLIFLFYPFHSECIFWLVGRSSLLATLFAMAGVYCFLRKKESSWWYILSLFCFMASLFSYESVWTLPLIIILLSFVYDKALTLKIKGLYIGGYWAVFFSYLIARFYLTNTIIGSPYGTQKVIPVNIPLWMQNAASLISRSFAPPMQSAVAFVACLGVMMIMIAFVLYKIRKHITALLLTLAAAYLLCLLPVIPFGIDTHYTESERFLYLPSAFLAMLLSAVLFLLFKNKTMYATGAFLMIEIVFLVMSYQSFAGAGKVAKTGVQALQSLQQTDSIYCFNLPGQYKGGFIFRNGIANAARLFAPQIKKVNIASRKELLDYSENYHLYHYPLSTLPQPMKKSNPAPQQDAKVAILVWTDSCLNVYR